MATRPRKLAIQALARKEKGFMSALIPEPGNVFVSIDLSAGEPTVTTHFSQDPMYRYACFDGVGKAPYYDFYKEHRVLMIDDIYLMTMSVSPIGKLKMMDAFNATYSGLTFAEQWLKDSEVIKKELKKERQLHKILALGLGYSMGPKKLVKSAYDNGHNLALDDAKRFFKAYWSLFEKIALLGKSLQREFAQQGYLVNPFGYRLVPPKKEDYKCLNYYIQSSVSGIMHVLCAKFFAIAKNVKFITVIHDEVIIELPKEQVDMAKAAMDTATKSLNDDLNWTVNIRTGWAVGNNLFEAK